MAQPQLPQPPKASLSWLGGLLLMAMAWALAGQWLSQPERQQSRPSESSKPASPSMPWPLLGEAIVPPPPAWPAAARPAIGPLPAPLQEPQEQPLPAHLEGALGLGDTLTLHSAQEPAMLPMARAELLLQQRSNDPLAALPAPLRLPLRQQLKRKTASFGAARVVVMPLPKLQTQLDVPLVRSATGDVDVYADTVPPAIANSLEQWLNNLEPLPPGQVQALLVKLTPWPATDASE